MPPMTWLLMIVQRTLSLALRAGQMGAYDLNAQDGRLWWSLQTYIVFGVTD